VNDRQDGPHAHSVWFYPTQNNVISVDLGSNQLWFTAIDSNSNTLEPLAPKTMDLNPGDGPRHLAFHPNGDWIYVLNELSNTVTLVRYDKDNGYSKDERSEERRVGKKLRYEEWSNHDKEKDNS